MPKSVKEVVLSLSVRDLDRFFAHIDMEPALEPGADRAHWHFRAYFFTQRRRHGRNSDGSKQVNVPMYSLRGQYLSARRIAFILHHEQDPLKESRLHSLCGCLSCVNPLHHRLVIKTRRLY